MINKYILREGILTPFSNLKMQSYSTTGTGVDTVQSFNGNPNQKQLKNNFDFLKYIYPYLLNKYSFDWDFNDLNLYNQYESPFENNDYLFQSKKDDVHNEWIQNNAKSLQIGLNIGNSVLKIGTDLFKGNQSTNGNPTTQNSVDPTTILSNNGNQATQQTQSNILNGVNLASDAITKITGNETVGKVVNTANDIYQGVKSVSNTTSNGVVTGANAALGALSSAGVTTGNETVDNTIKGAADIATNALTKNSSNGSIYGLIGSLASSLMGTSDNSVVRAGGQLLGNADNIINSVKGLSSASRVANMTKGAKDALAAGKSAADAAKAGRAAANATKATNVMNLASVGVSVLDTALFGNQTPSEYSGKKGGVTQGLDMAYDAIAAGIGFVPVIGTAASLIMAGNKFLGHGIKSLGGGTDGMTTTDAILGSSFMQATPLGMINGFGGKSTTAWTKDNDVYSKVGGSYLGSNALADEAEPYAGKKYGLFSSGARKKWENKIQEAIRQEKILRQIGNESERDKTLLQTMTGVNSQALNNILNGGYENTITFKKGGIFEMFGDLLKRANRIIIETKKTIIIEPKEEEKKEETKNVIPEGALHANLNHMDTEDITKKGIPVVDTEGKQQAEIERNEIIFRLEVTQLIENLKKDGSDEAAIKAGKLLTEEILYNTEDRTGLIDLFKQGGEILIAKSGTEVEKKLTVDDIVDYDSFYNYLKQTKRSESDFDYKGFYENEDMRNDWIKHEKENPGHAYMNDFYKLPTHFTYSKESKNGKDFGGEWLGNDLAGWMFKASPFNMSQHTFEEMKEYWDKNEPNSVLWYGTEFYKPVPKQELEEFKNGGTVNVIPEGNLHARLHHMENADGLTKKGIPVVDNDGDLQAEIELNEIIFRLEVTKKLEELSKKEDKDKAALEAGKLLVDEILNNTDDRTGLIKTI